MGMEFFKQTNYQQLPEFPIMVQCTLPTVEYCRYNFLTLSPRVISAHPLWHTSKKQLIFLCFWRICQMPNSAISTIPLLASLHLRFTAPWSHTCSVTNLKLAAIVRAQFDAKGWDRWDIYNTNLTWPSCTTTMENYRQFTNLKYFALELYMGRWSYII